MTVLPADGWTADKNSTFGEEVGTFFNPKIGASWVVSEESFYPEASSGSAISTLRPPLGLGLHGGGSPGSGASLTTFRVVPPFAISASSVGVRGAPPESRQLRAGAGAGCRVEFGFDASLFNEKKWVWRSRTTTRPSENLILSPAPPAVRWAFSQNPLVNIGELRNSGWEGWASIRRCRTCPNFSWDARVSFSTNTNEVTTWVDVEPFGNIPAGPRGLPGQRLLDPGGGAVRMWPTIRPSSPDTAIFIGNPNPGNEGNLNSTFTFFGGIFRLFAQLAWANDYILYNNSDQIPGDGSSVRVSAGCGRNEIPHRRGAAGPVRSIPQLHRRRCGCGPGERGLL